MILSRILLLQSSVVEIMENENEIMTKQLMVQVENADIHYSVEEELTGNSLKISSSDPESDKQLNETYLPAKQSSDSEDSFYEVR